MAVPKWRPRSQPTQAVEASVYAIPDERLGEEVGATLYAPEPG